MNNNIAQQIKEYNKGREKGPLKIKYRLMAENSFSFFRGTCHLFYSDLFSKYPFQTSPDIWACGDLHIENFGSYKGSNRLVYFDMNDFDEALLAPVLSEICRLAASVQVAANEKKFSKKDKNNMVNSLLNSYRDTLLKAKSIVIEKDASRGLIRKLITKVADRKEMDLVKKRTKGVKTNELLINDKLLKLEKQEKKEIINSFNKWLADNGHNNSHAIDAGFRIAGTGSVGVRRYGLLVARTDNPQKKLLIDVKQSLPPAPGAFIKTPQPVWQNDAVRTIAVQEMVEHVAPAFLSPFKYKEHWFVVKELQPTADKVDLFETATQPENMEKFLADLGILTASGQLRSSGRKGSATADELSHFAEDGSWVKILAEWSASYAEQVKQEYEAYKKAWENGFFKSK